MLTAKTALQIAADYGFSIRDGKWEKSLIRDSIIQARGYEAQGENPVALFDGYMKQTAQDIRAEGLRARDFARDAYGC
jgi:hypothetical protein